MERCGWVTQDPLYLAYHDEEWGKPQKDNQKLFEMICLEGQQAGLSWITVLKKREHYRRCFHHFDPNAVARMRPETVDALVLDPGIIRHRGKIEAIIANARAYLAMQAQGEDFSAFVWSFVGGTPRVNSPATLAGVPVTTPEAQALSKALKKRGFKFVGPTICYAFMQACGLVNDHLAGCAFHPEQRS
ncbi:DNA-3-methyladenine glycosylase [Cronobacter condimenti 1330]|uniref:DNA-3-methyladenine glycosylase I n=1 Tax=Cronobacter condimenti 1330 TaxID=1073999 RepID=K8AJM4_9ENTR|nr:DNA-3-methyladenine glycosylase I [Cronobacter condimenti]ALB64507.1 DNA-3-methyladenine glycosidase [Cronobacter condimenti 1330]CCJ74472.1 DNA-3-methyladenine glycosylase [Cronobacter condimenti 1330]